MLNSIIAFLAPLTVMEKLPVFLLLGILVFLWAIYRAHKGNNLFDAKDFLMDPVTNRASLYKLGQLVAMLVTSFGFIYLIMHNGLTEMYFGIYAGLWGGLNSVNKGIDTFNKRVDSSGAAGDNSTLK